MSARFDPTLMDYRYEKKYITAKDWGEWQKDWGLKKGPWVPNTPPKPKVDPDEWTKFIEAEQKRREKEEQKRADEQQKPKKKKKDAPTVDGIKIIEVSE